MRYYLLAIAACLTPFAAAAAERPATKTEITKIAVGRRETLKTTASAVALFLGVTTISSLAFEPQQTRVEGFNFVVSSQDGNRKQDPSRTNAQTGEVFCGMHLVSPASSWNNAAWEMWEITDVGAWMAGGAGSPGASGTLDTNVLVRYVKREALPKTVDWRTACHSDGYIMPVVGRDNIKFDRHIQSAAPPMHGCFNGTMWSNGVAIGSC